MEFPQYSLSSRSNNGTQGRPTSNLNLLLIDRRDIIVIGDTYDAIGRLMRSACACIVVIITSIA